MLSSVMDPSQEVCQQMDKLRTNGGKRASSGAWPMGTELEGSQNRAGKPGPSFSADIYHVIASCQELNTGTLGSEPC